MIAADPDLGGDLALVVGPFVLHPLADADAPALLAHFADPRVVEYMDIEPMTALDEAEAIVAWAKAQRALGAGLRFSIREGGAFAGTCGFNRLVVERARRGEVAYDLSPPWWGRGAMDAILPALADFAFSRLALHRLEALVTPGNHPSCRLLERHGFAREGVLAGHGFWKGRYQDQIVYGRLAPEGPGLDDIPRYRHSMGGSDGRAVAPFPERGGERKVRAPRRQGGG